MKRLSLRSNKTDNRLIEDMKFSILIFSIQGKEYALPVTAIQEIINYNGFTELPLMTNSVHGVVSLRGVGVPVFDLYELLSKKTSKITKRSCIIILSLDDSDMSGDKQILGVLVDSVSDVLEISQKQIEKAPHGGEKNQTDLFAGMIQVNGEFVLIVNELKLFCRTDNPESYKSMIQDVNKKEGL